MTGPLLTEAARDALVAAALRGVLQCFGHNRDAQARCALGVIEDAVGLTYDAAVHRDAQRLRGKIAACPECARPFFPLALVAHCNDVHRWDFLTIARKLG